jgi:hypothetical protein
MEPAWRQTSDAGEMLHQAGDVEARVDPRSPQKGVYAVRVAGEAFPAAVLLGADVIGRGGAAEIADQYVRGTDLVAAYEPRPEGDVRPQIYWRGLPASSPGAVWGMELIVSVQTGLLHSEPASTIFSELPADEVWRMSAENAGEFLRLEMPPNREIICTPDDGAPLFLLRSSGDRFSYAQMVYPSDFHRTTITVPAGPGADVRLAHELFPDPLEKGVIRRGRVRGWILQRQDDQRAAAELYRAWLAEPPPLTT